MTTILLCMLALISLILIFSRVVASIEIKKAPNVRLNSPIQIKNNYVGGELVIQEMSIAIRHPLIKASEIEYSKILSVRSSFFFYPYLVIEFSEVALPNRKVKLLTYVAKEALRLVQSQMWLYRDRVEKDSNRK